MIRHIVLTKFADPETAAPAAMEKLKSLVPLIPEIVSLEVGRDVLHSERSYDIGLTVTFRSMEDLARYADHPAHVEVKKYIHAHRTGSVTVDYEF